MSPTAIRWPSQFLVEASLRRHGLPDVTTMLAPGLENVLGRLSLTGRGVALAVGSRGIDRIAEVVRTIVGVVRQEGASPFIVPAMGSHGGATPEGQLRVLEALGITEQHVGAPVRSSLDTTEVGTTDSGIRVLTSRDALDADAVILVNRIKPHTDFDGAIGSGLLKMAAVGLGKLQGARECHRAAIQLGHEAVIRSVSQVVFGHVPIVCGVALIEDAYHQLARMEVLPASGIAQREEALLTLSRQWMPALPFDDIDVLIVDEIGKNVSGAGMDPNVIGRCVDGTRRPFTQLRIGAIYVRGLTPQTRGNAIGLGLADVVSDALVADMDANATHVNALSAVVPMMAKVPMHFATDSECVCAALRIAGVDEAPEHARILRVRNTLALDRFVASDAFADDIARRPDLRIVAGPVPWASDSAGHLEPIGSRIWEGPR